MRVKRRRSFFKQLNTCVLSMREFMRRNSLSNRAQKLTLLIPENIDMVPMWE